MTLAKSNPHVSGLSVGHREPQTLALKRLSEQASQILRKGNQEARGWDWLSPLRVDSVKLPKSFQKVPPPPANNKTIYWGHPNKATQHPRKFSQQVLHKSSEGLEAHNIPELMRKEDR